jgi:hypothetical protein
MPTRDLSQVVPLQQADQFPLLVGGAAAEPGELLAVPSCGLQAPAGLSLADPLGYAYSQSAASAGWSIGSQVHCPGGLHASAAAGGVVAGLGTGPGEAAAAAAPLLDLIPASVARSLA